MGTLCKSAISVMKSETDVLSILSA